MARMRNGAAQWVIMVVAVLMVVVGIRNGEARTVFEKAVNICLECIGIG